ncbi:class III extradiol dioxygenase subunit B-like domain-containing protein [Streptomyces sp. NPDC058374]|uniref:class III extradiol dioxygenase subunit B-like domain-containing protein n=1 Tax=unclassified Streptomyces TaxID=2593676 RepID=UPI003649D042
MLAAAAVCPCPPLLLPQVAAGAAAELAALRESCAAALDTLAEARPERLVVVGPDTGDGLTPHPSGAPGSFRGFGAAVDVTLGPGAQAPAAAPLPASLAVGAWLLADHGWTAGPVEGLAVGTGCPPERCAGTGRDLAAGATRTALLVLGDGSACRTVKAPGYLDERAAPFDASAAEALGAADTAALAAFDPVLAEELGAAGRAPWQVLAAAAADAELTGKLLHDEAPYGVGYFVAAWS